MKISFGSCFKTVFGRSAIAMTIYLWILLTTFSIAVAEPVCAITEVDAYSYSCNRSGWIQDPVNLETVTAATVKKCWKKCASSTACRSFRFIAERKKCFLYKRYLEDMYTDYNDFQPGQLYDRDCFSTSCPLISACKASSSCNSIYVEGYTFNTYDRFACGYGVTARFPKSFESSSTDFDGSYDACTAITNCADLEPTGPFDVHYDLKAKVWRCIGYNSMPTSYYPTMYEEHVSRNTYSVQNASVGAGYGYWIENIITD